MIISCARGCTESVNTLIDHKADLSCRDKRGNTALHWAVRRHYTHIAMLLIQGDCKMDILDMVGYSNYNHFNVFIGILKCCGFRTNKAMILIFLRLKV